MPTLLNEQDLGRHARTLRRLGLRIEPIHPAFRKTVQSQIGVFRLLDGGTERRIGDDTVKALVLETPVPALCRNVSNRLKPVSRHDVRMTIVMDDHVHLGRPRNLLVDLDAEKTILREPMPALVATNRRCAVFLLRRLAHLVERMQKESTRPAGRVKDTPVARDRQNIDDELHHCPRCEELPRSCRGRRTS